jgi:serine protease inhibitor
MVTRLLAVALTAALAGLIAAGCEKDRDIIIRTPPTASFAVSPASGTVDTVFMFDASSCWDAEDDINYLQVRWDWENDGTWDTDWSQVKTASHQYGNKGTKTVRLSVQDTEGLTGDTTGAVPVWSDDFWDGPRVSRQQLVRSANDFGFRLFREMVRQNPDSNVIASPLSVTLALGMLLNGACGATLQEMLSALELEGYGVEGADEGLMEVTHLLTVLDPEVQLEIANSIWVQEGFSLKPAFQRACSTYFDAAVRDIDFAGDPGAPDSINGWVSDKTHGKIPGVLPKPLMSRPLLILIDAIYFLAQWSKEFDPDYTATEPFTRSDGSKTPCRMMKRPGPEAGPGSDNVCEYEYYSEYSYSSNEGLQIVDLAYGDSLFSMTILLPWGNSNVDDLIASLDADSWNGWLEAMDVCDGRVMLPRFEIRFGTDLKAALVAMGMERPFSPGLAEFYRIADAGLCIDMVLHLTYIRTDEAGTEAAAVTVIIVPTGIIPDCASFKMKIDHPFVFVIHDRQTGTILFIGKVADPGYF